MPNSISFIYADAEHQSNQFVIAPSFQYFVTDRTSLGASVGWSTLKTDGFDRRNSISVGVFGRYYLLKTQRFGVFGQANAGARFSNEGEENWNEFSFHIAPGVQYFINNRWSVEAHLASILSFSSTNLTDGDGRRNWFSGSVNPFNLGLSPLSFSVNFHF